MLEAKTWLIAQRRELGWTHKDVEKAFSATAGLSDLYTGLGGGDRFDRATEKRVARFEREGQSIPDWMYWMPLAIDHWKFPRGEFPDTARRDWEEANIPEHTGVREARWDDDYESHLYYLDDAEIQLIERYRLMTENAQAVLQFFAEPQISQWLVNALATSKGDLDALSALVGEKLRSRA